MTQSIGRYNFSQFLCVCTGKSHYIKTLPHYKIFEVPVLPIQIFCTESQSVVRHGRQICHVLKRLVRFA